ncbi:MAG: S-methyl-5-thioribose-1-phosphate isomerase [Armatimonadota bacterium]
MPPTIEWCEGGVVRLVDQTRLPRELVFEDCTTYEQVADAIRPLKVRGAPAIGCAAAFGMAVCAYHSKAQSTRDLLAELAEAQQVLAATRPTAVNLFWALARMTALAEARAKQGDVQAMKDALVAEAKAIAQDDYNRCVAIGDHGAELIPQGANVLTHCNAGALATAGYGTALGVIRSAHAQGKGIHVWVDETRPLLQGDRLTAWELHREGIPATLICDNVAGSLMARGKVDCAVVGSDRIAANGDVANKIGTYSVAALCRSHGLPFFVAAPLSTVDFSLKSGADIPIEERAPEEVTCLGMQTTAPVAPEGVNAYNPAFDVTPADYVTAIITEKGVARPPYEESLAAQRAEGGD